MDLLVLGQVIGTGELLLTQRALIRLVAGVRAFMTRQLVGARELPRASVVGAGERFLAGVTS